MSAPRRSGADRACRNRGDADLALRVGPVEGGALRLRRPVDIRYRPFGSPTDTGVIWPKQVRIETECWMENWSGDRPIVLDIVDSSVMRAAVQAGLGTVLLPEFYVGDLRPVGEDVLARPLHLTLHEDKDHAPRGRLVATTMSDLPASVLRSHSPSR